MITLQKIAETKRSLQKGIPAGEIREQLRQEGHSDDDIKLCFKVHKYDMRSLYIVSGSILFMWGVVVFLKHGGFLLLILSVLMFWIYHRERKRVAHEITVGN